VFDMEFVSFTTPNGARLPYPINIKGHGQLSTIQSTKKHFFILFSLTSLPYFSNPNFGSSFVLTAIEGIFPSLSMLGQPDPRLL
jgi:hypothetical protein